MKFSPLFWPVELKGKSIYVLDEALLPQKVKYLKINNYKQAVEVIKEMKARAVGQVLLVMYSFILLYRQNKSRKDVGEILSRAADAFNTARPTLSFKFLTDIVLGMYRQGAALDKGIASFLQGLKTKRMAQAEKCGQLLQDKDVVLTHCNISGLMPLIGEICRQQAKEISFFVTETRPYLQGARLTAWELKRAGFSVTLIADNMAAQVMKEGKINKVIVGADNLAQNGDIANKIGTLQLAILADYFSVPFYVICPPASNAKSGDEIKIEVRPEKNCC
ncbi:MAG: hypothetical protein FJZ13_04740, partial [Candidatus Omnitrophica bacterium]|nr:hypothetical protein [Candidatus Omnitrophota bacterium]